MNKEINKGEQFLIEALGEYHFNELSQIAPKYTNKIIEHINSFHLPPQEAGKLSTQSENREKEEKPQAIPYQACPVCNGSGKVLAEGCISSLYQTCKVCNGAMIIPMALSPSNTEEGEKQNQQHLVEPFKQWCRDHGQDFKASAALLMFLDWEGYTITKK